MNRTPSPNSVGKALAPLPATVGIVCGTGGNHNHHENGMLDRQR